MDFAYIDQYFGLWAIEELRFAGMLRHFRGINLRLHVQQQSAAGRDPSQIGFQRVGDIAVIDISGTLMKRGSSLFQSSSTIRLRQAVRNAADDPDIGGIILRIDSPGGTVAGTADLASEVAAAARRKHVITYAEDLMASAGYWIGSQANEIYANNATALIGSIGTFIGLHDLSGMAEKEGIKAIVIRAGEFKGMGFPGTEIITEHQAAMQHIVDATQREFNRAIAAGRKLSDSQVLQLADGRLHQAGDAQRLKLIDGIASLDEVMARMARKIAAPKKHQTSNAAATVPAMRVEQTVQPVADTVAGDNPSPKRSVTMSAVQQWNQEVEKRMAAGKSRAEAIRSLVRDRPDLQRAYLEEANSENAPQVRR